MANPSNDPAPGRPEIPAGIVRQMREIRRVLVAIVVICLIVSVGVTADVLRENGRLKGQVARQQQQLALMARTRRLLQEITLDLRGLGATDKSCRDLLQKYREDFAAFRVDVVTGATMTTQQ